jgi:hypothetical protein
MSVYKGKSRRDRGHTGALCAAARVLHKIHRGQSDADSWVLVNVRRNWNDVDTFGRLLAMIDGMLVSGLDNGRVRAFMVATGTADS